MSDPLASPLDVQERLGRPLTTTESARIEAILRDVSAKVRSISSQTFTVEQSTVHLRRNHRGKARLSQRPVVSIDAVTDINGNPLYTRLLGDDSLYCSYFPVNSFEVYQPLFFVSEIIVTYTHGGPVPDDIIAVVCSVAARALGIQPTEVGITQENIDGYGYQLGSAAAQGGLGLLASEREVCESYDRMASPVNQLT